MNRFSFNQTRKIRKQLLQVNCGKDHIYIKGNNNVIISVPHGVSQTRLGKHKVAELGTIPMGIIVADNTNSHLIVKTKNNFDDANFDKDCFYREDLKQIIKDNNIKYLIDFHGLARWRSMDVNLGTHLENNVAINKPLFDKLCDRLNQNFVVEIDKPFMASYTTISGYFSKELSMWTIQIEINSGITNDPKNIEKFNLLANTLIDWINNDIVA